jgi:hypothetical protein
MFVGENSKFIGEEASTEIVIFAIFLLELMEIGILFSAFSTFITPSLLFYYLEKERRSNKKRRGHSGERFILMFLFF